MKDRKHEIRRDKYRDKATWKAYIWKQQKLEENRNTETDKYLSGMEPDEAVAEMC